MALDLSKIVSVNFPVEQYIPIPVNKTQIVLHHTVSGAGVDGDIGHWLSSKARVATSVIIDRKGVIHQCFSTKYWAHHLGVKTGFIREQGTTKTNIELNQSSVGIELDSYGGLVKKDGKFYTVYGNEIDEKLVVEYKGGFRGFYFYEKYTDAQIDAMTDLLAYLCDKYGIPSKFNKDMFDVSKKALNGVPGIYSHTSYRSDKSDVHPQKELIIALGGSVITEEEQLAADKLAADKKAEAAKKKKAKAAAKKKKDDKTKSVK